MMTHSDRQKLASGNELLAVSGRVINPTDENQDVPPIQAQLRSASGKLVYSWTIAPPARTLPPGASATFNSAEVNVPAGGDELTDHARPVQGLSGGRGSASWRHCLPSSPLLEAAPRQWVAVGLDQSEGAGVFMTCGRGGTGRRAALRSLWPKGRGSSSLLDRTICFDRVALSGHGGAGRSQRRVALGEASGRPRRARADLSRRACRDARAALPFVGGILPAWPGCSCPLPAMGQLADQRPAGTPLPD